MTSQRNKILKNNEAIRRGNAPKPKRLPDGEVTFRIPDEDWPMLMLMFPELNQADSQLRHKAWQAFRDTPTAEKYLVVRTPSQVRADTQRIIIP